MAASYTRPGWLNISKVDRIENDLHLAGHCPGLAGPLKTVCLARQHVPSEASARVILVDHG